MDGTIAFIPCIRVSCNDLFMSFDASPLAIFQVCIRIYRSRRCWRVRGGSSNNGQVDPIVQALATIDAAPEVTLDAFYEFYTPYFVKISYRATVFQFTPNHGFKEGEHKKSSIPKYTEGQ